MCIMMAKPCRGQNEGGLLVAARSLLARRWRESIFHFLFRNGLSKKRWWGPRQTEWGQRGALFRGSLSMLGRFYPCPATPSTRHWITQASHSREGRQLNKRLACQWAKRRSIPRTFL